MKVFKISGLIVLTMMILLSGFNNSSFAQKPYRVGTTSANFLEMGFGSAGGAMGEAYVSMATDLSAIYWNPAGLGYMDQSEVQFTYQPWFVDINTSFTAAGLVIPRVGVLALGIYQVDYGDMKVTTLDQQTGTGEFFSANDFAFSFSYSRKLAEWFSFGASAKYISSKIWHTSSSAAAVDLGVMLNTHFFSPTGKKDDGMAIGMSIANYGTKMKYDGMDLIFPIDLSADEYGNYRDVPGQYRLQGWELPLIFRVGMSVNPIVIGKHRLTVSIDALHPNNNSESINLGAQYMMKMPAIGSFYLRSGYKALFMDESEYGATFGGGFVLRFMNNIGLKLDYCYKDIGMLGYVHSYTMGFLF
ncbi:MAG TPA: PorV/PorQ family protein [bacterium]|nr:PorV/PorQ family protein [bacterium]HPN43497.1 PorV/PorQ family protein [bacterium]